MHAACHSEPKFAHPKALAGPGKLPRIGVLLATLFLWTPFLLAAPLTGIITNGTTGKPSPGDTIAVVNMARSMDEIVHATSGSDGTFHVTVPDDGQILLHVTHRGADYYKTISPGPPTTDIEVFDSAPKVTGITGEALVLRFETDPTGHTLNVSENFFVQNSSAPPRTEFGANTFDFYLPKDAQVTQSLGSSTGGLPTTVKLAKLGSIDAAQSHYAFTFPIRPGETRFQVNYTLPYSGKQAYSLKLTMPTGDVAVMLPRTMQFSGSPQFQPISPDPSSQSYDAHQPAFTQPLEFSLTGSGQLPQIPVTPQGASSATANGQPTPGAQTQPTTDTRPGGGLGIPDDPTGTNDPWSKYKWWILGGLGLALACGAGIMLRSSPAPSAAASAPHPTADITAPAGMYHPTAPTNAATPASTSSLLQALKDELFELEKDHLAGNLTAAEYAEHKAALNLVLRRALTRTHSVANNSGMNS